MAAHKNATEEPLPQLKFGDRAQACAVKIVDIGENLRHKQKRSRKASNNEGLSRHGTPVAYLHATCSETGAFAPAIAR